MGKVTSWDESCTALGEIEIEYSRTGYDDPGEIDCDPDDGREPMREESRDIGEIWIDGNKVNLKAFATNIINLVRKYDKGKFTDNVLPVCVADYIVEYLFQPIVDAEE